jgi:hypothetical protein
MGPDTVLCEYPIHSCVTVFYSTTTHSNCAPLDLFQQVHSSLKIMNSTGERVSFVACSSYRGQPRFDCAKLKRVVETREGKCSYVQLIQIVTYKSPRSSTICICRALVTEDISATQKLTMTQDLAASFFPTVRVASDLIAIRAFDILRHEQVQFFQHCGFYGFVNVLCHSNIVRSAGGGSLADMESQDPEDSGSEL